jgi:hypothetical protein
MSRKPQKQSFSRVSKGLAVTPTILIVTEGVQTEVNYFKSFPVAALTVKCKGIGCVTKSLVEETERQQKDIGADVVWCVFDYDDQRDFDEAVQLAKEKGYEVAYSIECFELWYLLHFAYIDGQIKRTQYADMLTRYMGEKYRKKDAKMYQKLIGMQKVAIKNAEKLDKYHDDAGIRAFSKRNPSTTVYKLVELLNQYVKE